uniref:Pectinesterase inhibitor domain-containing protein n=1 Tax=Oryza barthii TaxID=65489 RepID=A0A0D3H4Y0_9ORYZ
MPKSNTKVIFLVAAVTFTVFLLLTVPAIASDEQNPVGSSTAALTVHGGTPLQQGGDSKVTPQCTTTIDAFQVLRLAFVGSTTYANHVKLAIVKSISPSRGNRKASTAVAGILVHSKLARHMHERGRS